MGLSLISNVAWEVGFHFFVVPGLFVSAVLAASMRVCLLKEAGAIRSIGRSFALERGHFWTILGVVGFWDLCLQTGYRMIQSKIHNWRVSMWVIWPVVSVATAAAAAFSAVVYHDLRAVEADGVVECAAVLE